MTNITILEAMADPELFGKVFRRSLFRGDTWTAWKAFLAALFALPMDEAALEIYRRRTGRIDAPAEPFGECFVIAGRRSGKSLVAALVAVFLACFRNYGELLAPGEIGTIMVIASDRRQARVVLGYINGFFDSIPMLSRLVASRLKESIELVNRVRVEVHTSSFRSVRGYSVIACVADEIAFWPSEDSASPDVEVLSAVRPAMATVPGALLLCISSPYARRGALWEAYREYFGKPESPVLVWQADTRSMNSTVSRLTVEAAYLRDHAAASAEWGGQFRDDIESFISLECVESRVVPQRFELPPVSGQTYVGFTDPSGGAADSFTLAVAHFERDLAVLDVLRERQPPFSPEQVVAEFADVLRSYRISEVTGDRYAGEWPREQFSKRGVEYRPCERTRSELYLELLPAVMSGKVELLDSKRLVAQLCGLERRTARGGKDSIDHRPGAHDDVSNAAAGALAAALGAPAGELGVVAWMKNIAAGILGPDGTPKPPATPIAAATAATDACCDNPLPVSISGMIRCNSCGRQSWPKGLSANVTTVGPTRRDLIGRGSPFITDEYPTSPSMEERQKVLRRFSR